MSDIATRRNTPPNESNASQNFVDDIIRRDIAAAIVSKPTVEEARQVFEARRLIESAMLERSVPNMTAVLARFLDYVPGHDDVWISRRAAIARAGAKPTPIAADRQSIQRRPCHNNRTVPNRAWN